MRIVKLKQEGLARVLDGIIGMTFIVDRFIDTVDNRGKVAHVRDYRYAGDYNIYSIWSIGPEGYEEIKE